MKNKKGFTLIELLAVIVILAIIVLIAVPQILNILNKARLNAAKDSTYGIVKAAETYATNFMLENNGTMPSEDIEFECSNSGCNLKTTLTGYKLDNLQTLDFKGTKPTSGIIRISNNGSNIVAENLQINDFSCSYANDTANCTKSDTSETPEPTTPVVTGPTSETPSGDGYTGVIKIVYLDPTDLTKTCDVSNVNSDTGTTTGCMKWYAYNDDGTNYTMILDHNTTASVAWVSKEDYVASGGTEADYGSLGNNDRGPITVMNQLQSDIIGWNNSLSPRLITYDEVNSIREGLTAIQYGWLFDRTSSDCTTYGCLNNATGATKYGYWTVTPNSSWSAVAWREVFNGDLSEHAVFNTTDNGVRPVITVEKSRIS